MHYEISWANICIIGTPKEILFLKLFPDIYLYSYIPVGRPLLDSGIAELRKFKIHFINNDNVLVYKDIMKLIKVELVRNV
jgi:hypothetical protein